MDKKLLFFNLLYVILIISIICFMLWMVSWLQTEAKSCLGNPITYFKEKNPHIYCNCYDENGIFVKGLSDNIYNLNSSEG